MHTFTSTVHAIRTGADVIHYHGVGPALLSWIPRIFAPRATVFVTFHCVDRHHQKWGAFARFSLWLGEHAACLFPHATITVSRTLQRYAEEQFRTDAWYIPNGVTEPSAEGSDVVRKFGVSPNGYLLMVSRLVRHKGAHHLIKAYLDLWKRGETRGKKLLIVGDSAFTDAYVRELKQMAIGCPDIVFTGYLKGRALQQAFANCYAVVHPSESEGLPIAVLEAMSYGKTVLCSDIPENMEVIGEYGMAFRNTNVADLTRAMTSLLKAPAFVRTRGAAAREYVLTNYQWDDVAADVHRAYGAVTAARAAHGAGRIAAARAQSLN